MASERAGAVAALLTRVAALLATCAACEQGSAIAGAIPNVHPASPETPHAGTPHAGTSPAEAAPTEASVTDEPAAAPHVASPVPEPTSLSKERLDGTAAAPLALGVATRALSAHLPFVAEATRVGHAVNLGGERFMIWGSAKSGKMPKGLVASRHGLLYSSNMGSAGPEGLSVFRTDALRFERHVPVEGNAIELALSPAHDRLYVANSVRWGVLQELDAFDFTERRRIAVPGFPKWLTLNRDGTRLFASLWALDGVTEVDLTNGGTRSFRGPKGTTSKNKSKNPRGSALAGDERTLFVVNNADQTLSVIDVASMKERRRVRVGYAPRHIVANRAGSLLYISLTGEDTVVEFDVAQEAFARRFVVGERPKTLALSADERFLYAANFVGNSLSIVDLRDGEHVELALDLYKPSGLAVRPDDGFVYLSGFCTNDVWAVQRIGEGGSPRLPLGEDRDNRPCLTCFSTFEGCPYPPGSEPRELVESAARRK